jgi:transposase
MEGSAADVRQLEYGVQRYRDWVKAGVFKRIFDVASGDPDLEFAMLDATIVKVHRHAQGAKWGPKIRPLASRRAVWTTKILALTDALGNLVRLILLLGHRFDTVGVAALIKDIEFGGLIADKAFDSNWIIEDLNERRAKIVISQHQRRAQPIDIDKDIYKWRRWIENFFGKLREFKRIAMPRK